MPSWNDLLAELARQQDDVSKQIWIRENFSRSLQEVGRIRGGRNVAIYGTAFLQKPQIPGAYLSINNEDINGFMAVINQMDFDKGLSLILHTPGGVTTATEPIVSYLRSKFNDIEIIIPTMAMSAGTMISLSADRIVMGRQSQLGPIDPQMPVNGGGKFVSALAIIDQFERAKKEILADRNTVSVWAPILPTLGPALLQESQNAIDYSERIVKKWLANYMFRANVSPDQDAARVAEHFSKGGDVTNHGRRIDRDEARKYGVVIDDLEDDQVLQDSVLTVYHLMTILFEKSQAVKMMISSHGKEWIKNV